MDGNGASISDMGAEGTITFSMGRGRVSNSVAKDEKTGKSNYTMDHKNDGNIFARDKERGGIAFSRDGESKMTWPMLWRRVVSPKKELERGRDEASSWMERGLLQTTKSGGSLGAWEGQYYRLDGQREKNWM